MKTIILDIGDESADWIKYFRKYNIQKAKIYVKNPSEVPQGKKLEEGERGGHYYESEQYQETTSKFQHKNTIWNKYAEKLKNDPTGDINRQQYKEMQEWKHDIQHALSVGEIQQEDAEKLGWHEVEKVLPLPEKLYHVTTAKDMVIRNGLKTRDELNQERGAGLGGGNSDTISFTTDPLIAEAIKDTLLEAHYVANGQTTFEELIFNAKNGEGAKRPFYDDLMGYDDAKYKIQRLETNKMIEFTLGRQTEQHFNEYQSKNGKGVGWKGIDDAWIDGQGIPRYNKFARELTSDEKQDNLFELYKYYLWYRERAGGKMNPLFFLSDVKAIANIDPKQIETLEFKSKLGSKGYQVSALGEWRTWSGDAVEIVNQIHKAKVYVKNPGDVPQGKKLEEGERGGHYYESGSKEKPQEVTVEEKPKSNFGIRRNESGKPLHLTIYDIDDGFIHFETGKPVLLQYLHNKEKSPNLGSRFGQDIEPAGKYVIFKEPGSLKPEGWEDSAIILSNPLVLEWKNWKKELSDYYGKTGQELSKILINNGYDGIITIDGQNVSEIVLLKPKINNYDELKKQKSYKGFDGKYDVFQFEDITIKTNPQDLPTNASQRILACANSFKFSQLKNKPTIIFYGKSITKKFNWEDRNGQKHEGEYGGHADYDKNEIVIWDDNSINQIVYHEVGHFVYSKMFSSTGTQLITSLKGFESVDDIKKYYKMIEILKNHNVTIDKDNIKKILDDIDYVRNLGIMEDMNNNDLRYYDNGYNVLFAMEQRLKSGYIPDLTPAEEKEWKKFRKLLKAESKSNTLKNEWDDIWKTEGFPNNEYANRNNNETFAEFYQTFDRVLRQNENDISGMLKMLDEDHPKKSAFFKKYVMKKWLK